MIELLFDDLISSVDAFLNISSITVDGVQYVPITDAVVSLFDLYAQSFARIQLVVSSSILSVALTICAAHFFLSYIRFYRKYRAKKPGLNWPGSFLEDTY